jgi:hypothetical protein
MVRTLPQHDLDRLIRSNRNLKISLVVALLLVVPLVVGLVAAGAPVLSGPILGVGIGLLVLIPQRRLLKELGLTSEEAKRILAAARKR